MRKLTVSDSSAILKAVNKKTPTIEEIPNVFINCFGEVILITSAFGFKVIGQVTGENTFTINGVYYTFPD